MKLQQYIQSIRKSDKQFARIMRVLCYVSLGLFPFFCLVILEYMNFGTMGQVAGFFLYHRSSAFSFLAAMVLFGILLLICRRAVIACGILGTISAIFGYVHYMKVALNGDPFVPNDFLLLGNAGDLLTFLSGDVPPFFWLWIVMLIVWCVLLWLFQTRLPLSWNIRLPAAALAIFSIFFVFSSQERATPVLSRFELDIFQTNFQQRNYGFNGFTSGFILTFLSMNVQQPPDYSREAIEALFEGFESTPATKEYFDVIVLMSESFFDVRIMEGVEFSQNPLPNFDAILERPNTYSGMVYTTALGGGTVRPEFEMFTGLSTDALPGGSIPYNLMTRNLESHVWNYRRAGYHTLALHSFNETFYFRHNAFALLGFEKFLGEERLAEQFELEYVRTFVSDLSLFPIMEYFLEQAIDPTFLFLLTMQNHQPFPPLAPYEVHIEVTSDRLDEVTLSRVTTFTQGLYDADKMLGMLVDYIDRRQRPTVLLFFGDHLPNFGPNATAFVQSGMVEYGGLYLPDARRLLYSTPFLIYSNRELTPIFPGNRENHISIYYLLPVLAYKTGFHRTAYMNLLLDHYHRVPFYNRRLNMTRTADIYDLVRALDLVTYDRLRGGNYSVGADDLP